MTAVSSNTNVHIHQDNIGDDDATGCTSGMTNSIPRWLNPVAKVTVAVN